MIYNNKGGVGKTTTAATYAAALARQGERVILGDIDPQGSLSLYMGVEDTDNIPGMYELLGSVIEGIDLEPSLCILKWKYGGASIDLLPSSYSLQHLEREDMPYVEEPEWLLKKALAPLLPQYSRAIIDTGPSAGLLAINALAIADRVIVPTISQFMDIKGMENLIRTVGWVKERLNPKLTIAGALFTMVDTRTREHEVLMRAVRENYSGMMKVYNTFIPRGIAAAEASADEASMFDYRRAANVAKAYSTWIKEVQADERKVRRHAASKEAR